MLPVLQIAPDRNGVRLLYAAGSADSGAARPRARPAAGRRAGLQPVDVLIVEDDPDIRDSLAEILEEEGYRTAAARDGRHALELLREAPTPKVILLDLMMPVMSGEEFRREQLRDPELAPIPVFILSGAGAIEQQAAALAAVGYMRKPVDIDRLLDLMGSFCSPSGETH
jgi:CheY-like chemotaxis protein